MDKIAYTVEITKVAVISDPQQGFNATKSYTPGAAPATRTWGSNTVVFSGVPVGLERLNHTLPSKANTTTADELTATVRP